MFFLKVALSPVLLLFAAAFGVALWRWLPHVAEYGRAFFFEGGGIAAYLLLRVVLKLFRRDLEFLEVFCHELNHTFFAVLFFRRVISFSAHESRGGEVSFSGKSENPLITLAPYSFPLFAFFSMLISQILIDAAKPFAWGVVGFFIAFHLGSVLRQARPYQTDIRACGYVFSYAAILFLNIFWIPLVAVSSAGGIRNAWTWCLSGFGVLKQWVLNVGGFA